MNYRVAVGCTYNLQAGGRSRVRSSPEYIYFSFFFFFFFFVHRIIRPKERTLLTKKRTSLFFLFSSSNTHVRWRTHPIKYKVTRSSSSSVIVIWHLANGCEVSPRISNKQTRTRRSLVWFRVFGCHTVLVLAALKKNPKHMLCSPCGYLPVTNYQFPCITVIASYQLPITVVAGSRKGTTVVGSYQSPITKALPRWLVTVPNVTKLNNRYREELWKKLKSIKRPIF